MSVNKMAKQNIRQHHFPAGGGGLWDKLVGFLTKWFIKRFAKCFVKRVSLFREARGVVSLVSLFRKMARFGKTCFAKQRNYIMNVMEMMDSSLPVTHIWVKLSEKGRCCHHR
jgi:hypothetical protein